LVAFRPFLILSLCLFACLPAGAGQRQQRCLTCHPSHYVAQGVCTACHRGNPDAERRNIAHQGLINGRFARFTLGDVAEVRKGKRLMEQLACRRCHVSGNRGNRLATNLDAAASQKAPEELVAAIRTPAQAMPDFRLPEDRLIDVVTAILANARGQKPGLRERPLVVHFDSAKNDKKDIFNRSCGGCHRALTAKLGAIGHGDIGPNLSGLLSPYYPESFATGKPWTRTHLARWLKNPRSVRSWARMPPVALTDREFGELLQILGTEDKP